MTQRSVDARTGSVSSALITLGNLSCGQWSDCYQPNIVGAQSNWFTGAAATRWLSGSPHPCPTWVANWLSIGWVPVVSETLCRVINVVDVRVHRSDSTKLRCLGPGKTAVHAWWRYGDVLRIASHARLGREK
ncbi:hypothetical protein A8144_05825 [Mycobacterium leprae 3125609]|nr:hypothetical protein [Mycobacterium leprae]OAR21516.1 hypothetical protein A8144_05825 [Mycobacterium leprae 3125609]OAX70265.1 hypothetical protein A3216_13005 [Mycobacterium leprae 7935681]